MPATGPIRFILFVELLGGFGDLLIALPAIHALALTHPDASLHVLTFAPGDQLLVEDPCVEEVFVAPRAAPDRSGGTSGASAVLRRVLSGRRYDLIVSDTMYEDVPRIIEGSSARRIVTNLWRRPPHHELVGDRFLRILRDDGLIQVIDGELGRVALTPAERRWGETWRRDHLDPRRPTAVLNPHAGMDIKRWPTQLLGRLGSLIAKEGIQLVTLEGENVAVCQDLLEVCPSVSVFPPTSLRQLAAFLETVDVVVSADTGPARLAEAVRTPVACLYGPTWAGRYGLHTPARNIQSPYDCDERRPENFTVQRCWYGGECVIPGKSGCLEDICPASVMNAIKPILAWRAMRVRPGLDEGAESAPGATRQHWGSGDVHARLPDRTS